jgi:uncharacterized protein YecE (DUF72 family)
MDLFGGGTNHDESGDRSGTRTVRPAPVAPGCAEIAAIIPPALRLGTSSWSFPGWAGVVYDGEYTERQLARHGLDAYAQHPLLRCVGIDRSYYAPLDADVYAEYAGSVPDGFRFLVKAERLLVLPDLEDPRGGMRPNDRLFDPEYAAQYVIDPIMAGLASRAGPILFQFPPVHPARLGGGAAFAERLHAFLRALPAGPLYAVELRTPALFTNAYFSALADAHAVHCYNAHGSMIPLHEQLAALPVATQRTVLIRWMLHPRHGYNDARASYAPFNRIVDRDDATRTAIIRAAIAAIDERRECFVIVNNKAEGSSPLSVFDLSAMIAQHIRNRPARES